MRLTLFRVREIKSRLNRPGIPLFHRNNFLGGAKVCYRSIADSWLAQLSSGARED